MRILHLASEYPPAKVYGLGRFVHGLARAQAAMGDEVVVLTNSQGGNEDGVLREGVRVHRIPFPNPPRPADGIGEVLQFQACLAARFLQLRRLLDGVDVIATHDWLVALGAREVARSLGRPLVVTFHDEVTGKHFGLLDRDARFVRGLEALTAHDANHVIANSRYVAAQVERYLGVAPERVTAIPGGIDPALLDLPRPELLQAYRRSLGQDDEVLALYVGRLDPEKGLETLGEAMAAAFAREPRLRLLLAGSGKCEERLRARLEPYTERVRFVGYVRGEALSYLYRAVDMVLVPSLYEPFGLVALEGMLAGRAVVVAASGGLREIVRAEEDGILVPPGDAAALTEAVVRLAGAPELRASLGAAAATRVVEEHAWSVIAARTREVYTRVLGEVSRPCEVAPPECARPLVSVVLRTRDAPAQVEGALRSVLLRTSYPTLDVVVVDESVREESRQRVHALVEELVRMGNPVRLGSADEARGEYVCELADDVEVPVGGESWLEGLTWLLEDQKATSVRPTLVGRGQVGALTEPRRAREEEQSGRGCVLRKTGAHARPYGGASLDPIDDHDGGSWIHPVQLVRAGGSLPISIVVVAWGCLPWTRACIESVLAHTRPPFELILVDNGSPDETLSWFGELRDRLLGAIPVQVIANRENLGYPRGANQGIRAARGRDVVLLNNDARVRSGWLEALLAARDQGQRVGIVAPKILNEDGTVQNAGGVLHHPDGSFTIPHAGEDRLAPPVTEPRELLSAGGPCMLLTRALLDQVGPFDEVYSPGYFEDSDLCFRARAAGFELRYAPCAEVVHRAKVTSSAVAREGRIDVWGRFRENERLFRRRWADRIEADELERRRAEEAPERLRILLCYGKSETTTAAYCEAALRREHDVVTAGPGQELDLGEEATASLLVSAAADQLRCDVDLLLAIEGENYLPPGLEEVSCRTAWWAIDSHLHARGDDGWHFAVAPRFDLIAVAQRDHVKDYEARGNLAFWLPLACDPAVHMQPVPSGGRDLDLLFVGNVRPFHQRRRRLLDQLRKRFGLVERQGVWREDMARLCARARIVFNCSLAGDLNMRVFEGLASGALLLTDRIDNGLGSLFAHGEHLTLYDDASLERELIRWLEDPQAREAVAARGQRLVLRHHTYAHRMRELVRLAMAAPARRARSEVSP